MNVRSVHTRQLAMPPREAGRLVDGLASADDALWPWEWWPAMRLDRPLGVGAVGGHGPIRYDVAEYEPGMRVRFRFRAPRGFDGYHEFVLTPVGSEASDLRHDLVMRVSGRALLLWPIVYRPLHDALLEDALDKAEHQAPGRPPSPVWGWRVRLLRRALRRTARRARQSPARTI